METLKNLISCANCKNRLVDPVILPCGSTICSYHIENSKSHSTFQCSICYAEHDIPKEGIIKNKAILNALTNNIDRQVFGNKYAHAQDNVQKLEQKLNDCKLVSNDKYGFVHEFFSKLRNKIDLNEERFRLLFDETNSKLRSNVDNYEKECYSNLEKGEFTNFDDIQKDFNETSGFLNALHLDEGHWEWIVNKTRDRRIEAIERLEKLKDTILLDKSFSFILDNLEFRGMIYQIIK